MNYHEGVTLQSYLDSKGGKISVEQALAIFMPVLDALKEIHAAGILHRDISPDNLLIDKTGRVILIDFGAARQAMGEKSKSLSVIMKAGYSPIEQYYSKGEQGPWTDIYAVAASFYKTITDNVPPESMGRFLRDDLILPSLLGVKIDAALEKYLLKALAVKVKDRYQNVEEFQAVLHRFTVKGEAGEGATESKPTHKADDGKTEGALELILKTEQPSVKNAPKPAPLYKDRKRTIANSLAFILCGLFLYSAFSIFGVGDTATSLFNQRPEEPSLNYDPRSIVDLDADYYIDYNNGSIPIGNLTIGTRVVDPTWLWEFRTGNDYMNSGAVKPMTWII